MLVLRSVGLRDNLIKCECEMFGIAQKCVTSLTNPDCGIFGPDSSGFVAVIDAAFRGLRSSNPTTSQKKNGGPKNSDSAIFGDVCGISWTDPTQIGWARPRYSTSQNSTFDKIGPSSVGPGMACDPCCSPTQALSSVGPKWCWP